MVRSLTRSQSPALLVQLLAIAGLIGFVAAAPPVAGRMMLMPISVPASQQMLRVAIAHGASLVGPGPLPGSFVVEGDRAELLSALASRGVALLAAPAAGCGR